MLNNINDFILNIGICRRSLNLYSQHLYCCYIVIMIYTHFFFKLRSAITYIDIFTPIFIILYGGHPQHRISLKHPKLNFISILIRSSQSTCLEKFDRALKFRHSTGCHSEVVRVYYCLGLQESHKIILNNAAPISLLNYVHNLFSRAYTNTN